MNIPLKWTDKEYKYFNKKIPVVERENWLTKLIDKYFYWVVLGIIITANVWVWWMNYQTYLIRIFLKLI
ncbi:MAG: hypothetical protein MUP69_10360 [Candidatus Atribacteria bacterium]|nr:hypothetical protein [Candidatus Atribacteria bacterium]